MSALLPSRAPRGRTRRIEHCAIGVVIGLWAATAAESQVSVDWIAPTSGLSIAVDSANNVYTVYHQQALGSEIVLTRWDVNGGLVWQRSFDQTDPTKWEQASWVAVDGAGNAIVTGTLKSGYSNPVNAASLAMKWSPDGTLLWRRVYESGFDGSYTRRCLVDGDDNVYVLGMGSGPSGYVTKIKKFAPDGTPLWTHFDAAGIGAPVIFKRTPDDHIVVAGRSIYGSLNGYAKLDLEGQVVWTLTGVSSPTIGDVAGDAEGNTYVVSTEGSTSSRTVTRKLGPSGTLTWERRDDLAGFRVEVGSDQAAVVSGFPSTGAGAAFIKIDPDGGLVWSNLDADGPLGLLLHAQMLLDENDDAYLAAGTLFEMAVCKVRRDGSSAWTQTAPGSYANGMALGPDDNSLFVTGGTTTRWIDATRGPWQDLGLGLAGSPGVPRLRGEGRLEAGTPASVELDDALGSAPAFLMLGLSELNHFPFYGGTLVPDFTLPPGQILIVSTDQGGALTLATTWPPGIPSGFELYLQCWVGDAGGPFGFAASNALRAATP